MVAPILHNPFANASPRYCINIYPTAAHDLQERVRRTRTVMLMAVSVQAQKRVSGTASITAITTIAVWVMLVRAN